MCLYCLCLYRGLGGLHPGARGWSVRGTALSLSPLHSLMAADAPLALL